MKNEVTRQFAQPFSKEGFTHLDISVRHMPRGYNYFHGTQYDGHYRLSFNPCSIMVDERTGTKIRSSIMLGIDQWSSGFYIAIEPAARCNPHYVNRAFAAMQPLADLIRDAYERHDIETLKQCAEKIRIGAQKPAKAIKSVALTV